MRHSAAPTWAMGNSVSTTSGSSSSTPSPSPCARARMASTRSRISRALASSAWPWGVMTGRLPWRSNSDTPSSDSMLAMAWLTADCTRDSWRAAARKLPASATAANTRNWSRVRASSIGVSDLWNRSVALKDYHLTGSPRTGMLAASIRGHRRRRWTSTRPGRPGRGRRSRAWGGQATRRAGRRRARAGRRCWPSWARAWWRRCKWARSSSPRRCCGGTWGWTWPPSVR